jgi:integrase
MNRRRIHDLDLPQNVRRLPSGSYQLRNVGIIADKHALLHEIWAAWKACQSVENMTSLRYFADRYYESNNFTVLQDRTKADKRDCEKKPLIYFEGFDCTRATAPDLSRYLNLRFENAKRRANMELVWLRQVFQNAVAIGLHPGPSPAAELEPLKLSREQKKEAKTKKRLVSDADYQAMLAVAPDVGKVAMEIAYCTGCRPGDVLKLRHEDIGRVIEIEESKTGHQYSKTITPRLDAALELARTLPGQPFSGWVIRNRLGERYSADGWKTNWQTWKKRLPKEKRFTFQEIRIKAISEATGDKQAFSMHSNARMLGIYDKTLIESPSHK